jgi:NAD(P)H-dependent nitrite reductase small subunit
MCYDCLDEDALHEASEELNNPAEPIAHEFTFACRLDEIPQNGSRGKAVTLEHTEVALFILRGEVYAISNICPHELSPLLAEGYIDKENLTVACPLHGWTYNIATGKSVVGSSNIPTYRVKVADGEVWVEEPPLALVPITLFGQPGDI